MLNLVNTSPSAFGMTIIFPKVTRSAAVSIRRVISYADEAAVLGEPLSKGALEW